MPKIENRNGRFRVNIRRKGIDLAATFEKEEDAILWINYKHYLIDMINAFDPPLKEMISLRDAIELKIKKLSEKGVDTKTLSDYKNILVYFEKFSTKSVGEITYTDLINHFEYLMTQPIKRGGFIGNDQTGHKKLPSSTTIFRKFAYLSTVYQMLIEDGVDIENIAIKVCQFHKDKKK